MVAAMMGSIQLPTGGIVPVMTSVSVMAWPRVKTSERRSASPTEAAANIIASMKRQ